MFTLKTTDMSLVTPTPTPNAVVKRDADADSDACAYSDAYANCYADGAARHARQRNAHSRRRHDYRDMGCSQRRI